MEIFDSLPGMIRYVMNTYRNSSAFNYKESGEWRHISTEVFLEKIRRLALGLKKLGIKKGDTIGIMARPSPFWLIIDLAIMTAGGISCPLFSHVSKKNFEFQVNDAQMKYLFVVGDDLWQGYQDFRSLFKKIITLDVAEQESSEMIDMRHLMVMGDALSAEDPSLYIQMGNEVKGSDLATIIYTSGSTGTPKGVELTHRNIISQINGGHIRITLDPKSDRALSCLPLAHIFERTLMYFYISSGISIYFVDEIQNVSEIAKEIRPTISAMVPRLVEKIYAKIERKVQQGSFIKKKVAHWAFELAQQNEESFSKNLQSKLADKLVYQKIRSVLGGKYRCIIVGGASLNPDLCRFFLNIGIPLYQGYGLTETSPVIATNFPGCNKPGTVGPTFPGVELSLTEEGEIIVKGDNVMRGYHNNKEATSTVIDAEGWFHTGDKGCLDEEGFLKVTGRVKEIFKTSGGKMVSPVPIEQALCLHPLIDLAMIIAEARRCVSVLLFPDFDYLQKLKTENSGTHYSDEEFLESDFIRNEMAKLLETVNEKLNRWEKIRKYSFVPKKVTVEDEELTPTLKIRRTKIEAAYAHLIEGMYQDSDHSTTE